MLQALLQPGAKGIFKKLSYAPLKAYIAEGPEVVEILEEYATSVLNQMGSIVASKPVDSASGRRTLCVFGHAVYSAAVAHLCVSRVVELEALRMCCLALPVP